ncbi:MAG: hypothetical protein JWN46_1824 [Acidimicrobiales bacterium]|nr:hypothetical protein [Acidimicrobiales bacterium]
MGRISVSTVIDAPPARVWDVVRRIENHVDWMADAEAIRFTSRTTAGVGTTFECVTRVGPVRFTDVMEITEWRERRAIGVRHVGLVTGSGRFTLRRARGGRTRFAWDERLTFPWWMGGPVGGLVGGQVMRRIWRGNLRTLKGLVER